MLLLKFILEKGEPLAKLVLQSKYMLTRLGLPLKSKSDNSLIVTSQ